MLFQDEFDGPAGPIASRAGWATKHQSGKASADWNGWANLSLDGNSHLVIEAIPEPSGRWTSGWLTGTIPYEGPRHVEALAEVAGGLGCWSAPVWEWAYPYGQVWSEIDVCEQLGREPKAYETHLHASATVQPGGANPAPSVLATGEHLYAADIYDDHVDFFLDGKKTRTITRTQCANLWPFTSTKTIPNISLNMGGWGGKISVTKPVKLLVDYLHVEAL